MMSPKRKNRDDFSTSNARILGERVAYRCSNPDCGATTRGPSTTVGKSVNVGIAAHITAAAPNGPRYDPTLSAEERQHISNGIHLCQICAKLIDSDRDRFNPQLLHDWKTIAEAKAKREIGIPTFTTKGRFARFTSATRKGAEFNVIVGGTEIPTGYIFDPSEDPHQVTFFVNALVYGFKVRRRHGVKRVVVDEVDVVVHKHEEVPAYESLYAVYPADTSLYLVTIDAPAKGSHREFMADRFYDRVSDEATEVKRFVPLVLTDDTAHPMFVRLNAARPGLYSISIHVLVSRGLKQERHVVLPPTSIILANEPTFEDD